ncbi:pectinesterase-like [Ipomoea triloba]|uniref:pectinesterase-like n=1 Tax=Ipomoea triloba TaxID=35885 RepID=UPI00125E15DA|nr:pectinesterase-like [Ipomoea triloba]
MTLFHRVLLLITLLSIHLISIAAHLEWPPPPTTAATAAYSNNLVVRDIIPSWLPSKERKLLQMSPGNMRIDAVVASDGSGQFARIGDALKAVPDNSGTRFVIYVKEGVYVENVVVEATKSNVMIIGDGMDSTVVSGSLSTAEESSMFSTATFGVLATDFIACDIGFENTAGAAKNQAVALAAAGDRGVFYRCKMVGFQDTLYAQSNRQFFRDCAIYGTIDFICGDSAAVFQNCDIRPRRPLPGQFNSITAQSRSDPSSQTGFSFQDCRITAAEDLSGVQTFLGRPWMSYSRTIFMHTYMDSVIDPRGWVGWTSSVAPDTVYYAEFGNYGPGAATANRVEWRGLHLGISSAEAARFSVDSFIGGSSWLPGTGVSFNPGTEAGNGFDVFVGSCDNTKLNTAVLLICLLINVTLLRGVFEE